ncbi:polysaccharide deacetylase family protein [Streptomyces sp. NPDC093109]|uniref:polysaccharide deacetylase family protein n=1 Tax=Streptomyces sp. NPDC093109 TaxID=3154977 RepID=UPI00344EF147
MRQPLAALITITTLLAVTACSASDSSDSSAGKDSAGSKAGADGSPVSPAQIPGLRLANDSSEGGSCRWATSYPVIPGADALTAALKAYVEKQRDSYIENRKELDGEGSACADGASEDGAGAGEGGHELNVSFSFLAASADVVGLRFTRYESGGAGGGLSDTTMWFDGSTGKVVPALSLISDNKATLLQFANAVKNSLKDSDGVTPALLTKALVSSRESSLDNLSFTPKGDLRVAFSPGTVGPPDAGAVTAEVPSDEVKPMLSDFGGRVWEQILNPGKELTLDGNPPDDAQAGAPGKGAADKRSIDCLTSKCVALTFDDGPGQYTQELLKHLAEYNARATFFLVGRNAELQPGVVKEVVAAGHELGSHSWEHRDLSQMSAGDVQTDLDRTNAAIKKITGSDPTVMRPPYGAHNATVDAATKLPMILWSVDTEDWKYHDSAKVSATVTATVKPGDIVLMHDIHATSVAAVPSMLEKLKADGYEFVTVSELYGPDGPKAGAPLSQRQDAFGRG